MKHVSTSDLIEKIKQVGRGRWREILHHVGGIPLGVLDGRWHQCPKCGAADAFRLVCNDCGCVECRVCKPLPIAATCSCGRCAA